MHFNVSYLPLVSGFSTNLDEKKGMRIYLKKSQKSYCASYLINQINQFPLFLSKFRKLGTFFLANLDL